MAAQGEVALLDLMEFVHAVFVGDDRQQRLVLAALQGHADAGDAGLVFLPDAVGVEVIPDLAADDGHGHHADTSLGLRVGGQGNNAALLDAAGGFLHHAFGGIQLAAELAEAVIRRGIGAQAIIALRRGQGGIAVLTGHLGGDHCAVLIHQGDLDALEVAFAPAPGAVVVLVNKGTDGDLCRRHRHGGQGRIHIRVIHGEAGCRDHILVVGISSGVFAIGQGIQLPLALLVSLDFSDRFAAAGDHDLHAGHGVALLIHDLSAHGADDVAADRRQNVFSSAEHFIVERCVVSAVAIVVQPPLGVIQLIPARRHRDHDFIQVGHDVLLGVNAIRVGSQLERFRVAIDLHRRAVHILQGYDQGSGFRQRDRVDALLHRVDDGLPLGHAALGSLLTVQLCHDNIFGQIQGNDILTLMQSADHRIAAQSQRPLGNICPIRPHDLTASLDPFVCLYDQRQRADHRHLRGNGGGCGRCSGFRRGFGRGDLRRHRCGLSGRLGSRLRGGHRSGHFRGLRGRFRRRFGRGLGHLRIHADGRDVQPPLHQGQTVAIGVQLQLLGISPRHGSQADLRRAGQGDGVLPFRRDLHRTDEGIVLIHLKGAARRHGLIIAVLRGIQAIELDLQLGFLSQRSGRQEDHHGQQAPKQLFAKHPHFSCLRIHPQSGSLHNSTSIMVKHPPRNVNLRSKHLHMFHPF